MATSVAHNVVTDLEFEWRVLVGVENEPPILLQFMFGESAALVQKGASARLFDFLGQEIDAVIQEVNEEFGLEIGG